MKIKLLKQAALQGGALLMTMGVVTVSVIILGSYLTLIQFQSAAVARSQAWNTSIALSEAGIEEAMAMINVNSMATNNTALWDFKNHLAANGWSAWTNNSTTLRRYVYGSNYFTTSIVNFNGSPQIESVGTIAYTSVPWVFAIIPNPFLAEATLNNSNMKLSRKVVVKTSGTSTFPMGMLAKENITFSGNVDLDSYDSSDPDHSTNGKYDASKAKDGCGVGTDADVVNAISGSGTIKIKGTVHTGPHGGVTLSGNAAIGDFDWINGGNKKIQPGHHINDMNMDFPDVTPPPSNGLPPTAGVVNGVNYSYVLSGNDTIYTMNSLSMSGQNKLIITGTNVTWWVKGSISMSGQTSITLAPGATVKLYVGNTSGSSVSVSFSGQGIVNAGKAADFQYYGLPTNTSINYSGGSSFIGVIYAPRAAYNMSGNSDYFGASVTKSVSKSGTSDFHYDESLKNISSRGFLVTSWQEVPVEE